MGDSVTLYFPDCCHGVEEVIYCNVWLVCMVFSEGQSCYEEKGIFRSIIRHSAVSYPWLRREFKQSFQHFKETSFESLALRFTLAFTIPSSCCSAFFRSFCLTNMSYWDRYFAPGLHWGDELVWFGYSLVPRPVCPRADCLDRFPRFNRYSY